MHLIVEPDAARAATRAAREIADACRDAVDVRGRAVVAVSGGETPWRMLECLRDAPLPWESIYVAQVDERVVAADDPRRNLARLEGVLCARGPLPAAHLLAMPVEQPDLVAAAAGYASRLAAHAGVPPQFDLVQLGLGADGHTASLFAGDPAVQVRDRDVAIAGPHEALARMTLTLPVLDRARSRLWLVTGAAKRAALESLLLARGDAPSSRVERASSVVVTDESALSPGLARWVQGKKK